MVLYWLITAAVIILTSYYVYCLKRRKNFEENGIPFYPESIPFQHMFSFIFQRIHFSDFVKNVYNYNSEAKYILLGAFTNPVVLIRDMELMKSVLIKNFEYFTDHQQFVDDDIDPIIAKNLAFLNGEKWREVRNLLSPAFTSKKMKAMFHLMQNCAENFTSSVVEKFADKNLDIDVRDMFKRYTNDTIATCAFGIEIDSIKNPNNDFFEYGKISTFMGGARLVKILFMKLFPTIARLLGLKFVPPKASKFFHDIIEETIKTRDLNGINRSDMLQLMMEARGKTSDNLKLDITDMTANAFIFFLGGFETTSIQLSIVAQELAMNMDIQEKLHNEIDKVFEETGGKLTYESVNAMLYLDAVFHESLRRHSQLPFLNRLCTRDFELPPALPGSKTFVVKPGMEIMIPVSAVHSDPSYYENPEAFDPDRFLKKDVMPSDSKYLGFGLGPRMCIGNRFAILESKVVLVHLLRKCSFKVCPKTCIPFEYDKSQFAAVPKNGFFLAIETREAVTQL